MIFSPLINNIEHRAIIEGTKIAIEQLQNLTNHLKNP